VRQCDTLIVAVHAGATASDMAGLPAYHVCWRIAADAVVSAIHRTVFFREPVVSIKQLLTLGEPAQRVENVAELTTEISMAADRNLVSICSARWTGAGPRYCYPTRAT
jgi:hypothetical protein